MRPWVLSLCWPAAAERKIYEAACLAARAFAVDPRPFSLPPLHGPYSVEIDYRANFPGVSASKRYRHEEDLIAALNLSWEDYTAPGIDNDPDGETCSERTPDGAGMAGPSPRRQNYCFTRWTIYWLGDGAGH